MLAVPPATLEGWYALHQVVAIDRHGLRSLAADRRAAVAEDAADLLSRLPATAGGWSAAFQLVAGGADCMLVHFRETLDELARVERAIHDSPCGEFVDVVYDYLSVTEAGLYHATAEAAKSAEPGSADYQRLLDESLAAELASPHIRSRLYPEVPDGMDYVSFYPMSKRRVHPDNWYSLPVGERSRLMREHGLTGRRFAGRIFQVITGSVGLDDWEWGVTLFARDPLEFKRIVTEMRYDEASAKYGEFGSFYTGIRIEGEAWRELFAGV
jgi:chlorite dismutase